jgi:hypothetical protein
MWLLATSSLSGDSRFSMWSSVDGLSWSFQGATDLPTNFVDLRTDFPVTGFVLGDRMRLLATSSLSGDSRFSVWSSVDGLSWSFQGATDLPTNFVDLRTDFPVTGFVLGDRMWLLATSSLSGDSRFSMWECE